jgi:hypothetical protein
MGENQAKTSAEMDWEERVSERSLSAYPPRIKPRNSALYPCFSFELSHRLKSDIVRSVVNDVIPKPFRAEEPALGKNLRRRTTCKSVSSAECLPRAKSKGNCFFGEPSNRFPLNRMSFRMLSAMGNLF